MRHVPVRSEGRGGRSALESAQHLQRTPISIVAGRSSGETIRRRITLRSHQLLTGGRLLITLAIVVDSSRSGRPTRWSPASLPLLQG
ncbi:hypothetical protein OH76DRAFT_1197045 [Lentinus brumalis]|uniref:Uncharacterized protein n=1 Tax=Lentinus brumalis TaxID=2498619 RepID=A0A371CTE0_9APHY|nr:hypothetical protein OH76DRAFT_1197045 [Polyporus brumalis]